MAKRGDASQGTAGLVLLRPLSTAWVTVDECSGAWIRFESFREVRGRVRSPRKFRWFGPESEGPPVSGRLERHVFAELRRIGVDDAENPTVLAISSGDFDVFLNGRKRGAPSEVVVVEGDVLRIEEQWLRIGDEVIGPRGAVEANFLRDVRQSPKDDDVRRVYADWLEEHEDFARAEFIRLDLAIRATAQDDPSLPDLVARFRVAGKDVGSPSWRTAIARPLVENCDLQWELVCPKRWDNLTPTDQDAVRHCDACDQNVVLCSRMEDARAIAAGGGCIAVDPALERSTNDLHPRPIMLGRIA